MPQVVDSQLSRQIRHRRPRQPKLCLDRVRGHSAAISATSRPAKAPSGINRLHALRHRVVERPHLGGRGDVGALLAYLWRRLRLTGERGTRPSCTAVDKRRGTATERGCSGRGHQSFRNEVLDGDEICVLCQATPANAADHYPIRRDLVAAGIDLTTRTRAVVCASAATPSRLPQTNLAVGLTATRVRRQHHPPHSSQMGSMAG